MRDSQDKFYRITSWILVNVAAPILLVIALSPSVIDNIFSDASSNRKITIQILCYSALFILMMKSAKAAIGVTVWAIIISVFLVAYEINRFLPK
jgi:hypothetical protein